MTRRGEKQLKNVNVVNPPVLASILRTYLPARFCVNKKPGKFAVPLWAIQRLNRPRANSDIISIDTLMPPGEQNVA